MKKFWILSAVAAVFNLLAAEVTVYNTAKKSTPVTAVMLDNSGEDYILGFKVAPETPEDFAVGAVYIFVDTDRNTGRKGMGNEYFLDVKKMMVSTYTADGQGTLHRKAVSAKREGQWYMLVFSKKLAPAMPINECEVVFNVGTLRDRAVLRGTGNGKETFPATVNK